MQMLFSGPPKALGRPHVNFRSDFPVIATKGKISPLCIYFTVIYIYVKFYVF